MHDNLHNDMHNILVQDSYKVSIRNMTMMIIDIRMVNILIRSLKGIQRNRRSATRTPENQRTPTEILQKSYRNIDIPWNPLESSGNPIEIPP